MARILPEEVTDKRLRQEMIPRVLHEEMLDLTGHPAYVEDPVGALHPFQVNGNYPEFITEENISGGHITVDENLIVLPHVPFLAPPVFERIELLSFIPPHVPPVLQLAHDAVEICAVPVEVHTVREGCPVVEGREKIGQSGEFLKEGFPRPFMNCPDDVIVEGRTIAELLHQHTVEAAIIPKGTGDIVGIPGKTDTPQVMEIVEFPFHVKMGGLV
jgi:hypothetical protein